MSIYLISGKDIVKDVIINIITNNLIYMIENNEAIENNENLPKKAFEDTSLENPFEKIKILEQIMTDSLDKEVMFGGEGSSLLYFSDNEKWIEEFSRIFFWHSKLILPSEKVDAFWNELRDSDCKTLGEVLNKTKELLSDIKDNLE